MSLISAPCRDLCDWRPADTSYDGEPIFACEGCGSQWVRSQAWTPKQADGSVPPGVQEQVVIARPWTAFGGPSS